jgi:hypothetical protein
VPRALYVAWLIRLGVISVDEVVDMAEANSETEIETYVTGTAIANFETAMRRHSVVTWTVTGVAATATLIPGTTA